LWNNGEHPLEIESKKGKGRGSQKSGTPLSKDFRQGGKDFKLKEENGILVRRGVDWVVRKESKKYEGENYLREGVGSEGKEDDIQVDLGGIVTEGHTRPGSSKERRKGGGTYTKKGEG